MDEQRRLEIAGRIKELREQSPYTQPAIADRIGVTVRAYQKWEQTGGLTGEHLEELAKLHNVTPEFIWRGQERGPTPDLSVALNGSTPGVLHLLTEINRKLDKLLAEG